MPEFEVVKNVEIPMTMFVELVRKAEKIDTVKRFAEHSKYVSVEEILAILGIKVEVEDVTDAKEL